jgi:hypothetical protein
MGVRGHRHAALHAPYAPSRIVDGALRHGEVRPAFEGLDAARHLYQRHHDGGP